MTNPDAGASWDEISPPNPSACSECGQVHQAPGLGRLIERLLGEHWPNCGVNAWYLADLLRVEGVRLPPTEDGGDE